VPAPGKKDQEWHDAAAALVENGRTPEGARAGVTLVLASHLTTTYLDSGKAALADGHETHAAMYVLAHSALQNLPRKIHEAGDDQAAARAAVTDARDQLRRTGSMLDMMHPSGRQPVFRNADEVLGRFEAFLSPDTAEGS
jgi:uncharacterized protein YgfB (UPF0149 family)